MVPVLCSDYTKYDWKPFCQRQTQNATPFNFSLHADEHGKKTHCFPKSPALIKRLLHPLLFSPYCFIKETIYERQFYYLENLCFLVWFFFSFLTLNTVLLVTVLWVLISFKCDPLQKLSHGITSFPFIVFKCRPTKDVISTQNLKLRSHKGNLFPSLGSLLHCSVAKKERNMTLICHH